mgnify:CR=1 FL=1
MCGAAVAVILEGDGAQETAKVKVLAEGGAISEMPVGQVANSGAPMADVSSGVEDPPGEKNVSKIKAFLDASRRL